MYFSREFNPNHLLIEDAQQRVCPFNVTSDGKCAADGCMAWVVTDDGYIRATTDNISTLEDGEEWAAGDPGLPDQGDGWEADGQPYSKPYHRSAKLKKPAGTEQRWRRRVGPHKGMCGRTDAGRW